jgi:sugar lactone lactonase YvrE
MQLQESPRTILSESDVSTAFEGTMTDPQLDHPEGLAFDREGRLYCGGERGQIYRITLAERRIEQVGDTRGFCLGMAFDQAGRLFICDSRHAAVMTFDPATSKLDTFATEAGGVKLRIPNFPAFDATGRLYVSDSFEYKDPGPGIFRFDPDGRGILWCREPLNFANGLALAPDGQALYVVETFAHAVSRIPIREDGSAGPKEHVASVGRVPDGLAFDAQGRLYVACYEPSALYRVDVTRTDHVETVWLDEEAQLLCHPTNCAFWDKSLYVANIGRCHISRLDVGASGLLLPPVL